MLEMSTKISKNILLLVRKFNILVLLRWLRATCRKMGLRICVIGNFMLLCIFVISFYYTIAEYDEPIPRLRTCNETDFCRRLRNYVPPEPCTVQILIDSVNVLRTGVEGKLVKKNTQDVYTFNLTFLVDATIRLTINEEKVYRKRFRPVEVLAAEPESLPVVLTSKKEDKLELKTTSNKVILSVCPIKIEIYNGPNKNERVLVANDLGKLTVEYNQQKPENCEEHFDGFVDSKPFGSMAVALDFSFPKATNVYGLPLHADSLSLKSTTKSDPYRLFNIDNPAYDLYSTKSLYGSVPFIIAHGLNRNTVGVFWFNAAATWVDITKANAPASDNTGINTYFMSETGMLDVFFVLGPGFYDVTRQYIRLTGFAPIPPYFSLGYHQSRWNYVDEKDAITVAENFDKYNIPLDVLWLDIEYTDAKKYFTWHPENFKYPENVIDTLVAKKRKLVVIIDPHIKHDDEYSVYKTASKRGLFVKNRNGYEYEGRCWPGMSSYLDFLNPQTREYYASLYSFENFKGTTNDVFIWNDMNEPAVFGAPEKTIPNDAIHYMNWEHRDIHNIYGFLHGMSTYEGLLKRCNGTKRPFILTRSHFAGTQRYAAIWTGDNVATWEYLTISVPMCLSSALGGISFCGADVGGFQRNPDAQLMSRWYQTGAYLPFFRAHSSRSTQRREPWLFDTTTLQIIREAINERQSLLPFWYTLFYKYHKFGSPVIRPIVMEFPTEPNTFDIDYEFLVGDSILVRPVTAPNVTEVDVYFPGLDDLWYSKKTYASVTTKGSRAVDVTLNEIPVFFRGGYIIPIRNNIKQSAIQTLDDPITLIIALDKQRNARGDLYVDDGETFAYRKNNYIYLNFEFHGNQLSSRFVDNARFATGAWIEQIVIFGISDVFKKAVVDSNSKVVKKELQMKYDANKKAYTVYSENPTLSFFKEWSITFE